MARPKKLDEKEIEKRLAKLDGWEVRDGKLHRKFTFEDFTTAFGFMTSVALAAEKMDHHPEWFNVYSNLTVDLATHDAGGITDLDFELARKMDRLKKDAGKD